MDREDAPAAATATATHLIVGLMISRLEKLHPGFQYGLMEDFGAMLANMRAIVPQPSPALDAIEAAAKSLLEATDN